jgi:hypothetical protein
MLHRALKESGEGERCDRKVGGAGARVAQEQEASLGGGGKRGRGRKGQSLMAARRWCDGGGVVSGGREEMRGDSGFRCVVVLGGRGTAERHGTTRPGTRLHEACGLRTVGRGGEQWPSMARGRRRF